MLRYGVTGTFRQTGPDGKDWAFSVFTLARSVHLTIIEDGKLALSRSLCRSQTGGLYVSGPHEMGEGRDDCVVLARRFVPMTASNRDKRPANSCESESRQESLHRSIM